MDNKSDGYWTPDTGNKPGYYVNEDDSYNCSELVWKAFKKNGDINLDSNGGLAVYPNNIKNSGNVTYVRGIGN